MTSWKTSVFNTSVWLKAFFCSLIISTCFAGKAEDEQVLREMVQVLEDLDYQDWGSLSKEDANRAEALRDTLRILVEAAQG